MNEERRDAAKNDSRRILDAAGQSNPELMKEMIYSWQKGFKEDQEEQTTHSTKKNDTSQKRFEEKRPATHEIA